MIIGLLDRDRTVLLHYCPAEWDLHERDNKVAGRSDKEYNCGQHHSRSTDPSFLFLFFFIQVFTIPGSCCSPWWPSWSSPQLLSLKIVTSMYIVVTFFWSMLSSSPTISTKNTPKKVFQPLQNILEDIKKDTIPIVSKIKHLNIEDNFTSGILNYF